MWHEVITISVASTSLEEDGGERGWQSRQEPLCDSERMPNSSTRSILVCWDPRWREGLGFCECDVNLLTSNNLTRRGGEVGRGGYIGGAINNLCVWFHVVPNLQDLCVAAPNPLDSRDGVRANGPCAQECAEGTGDFELRGQDRVGFANGLYMEEWVSGIASTMERILCPELSLIYCT